MPVGRWTFLTTDYDGDGFSEVAAVASGALTQRTEVHVLRDRGYDAYALQAITPLHPTDPARWRFSG